MADINISVNEQGLFTIQLDVWEWEKLSVNGQPVPKYDGPEPNVQYKYVQETAGTISFKAEANHNIEIVNPPTDLKLKATKDGNDVTYLCIISYGDVNDQVNLYGLLTMENGWIKGAESGPLQFNQGRMTGHFLES